MTAFLSGLALGAGFFSAVWLAVHLRRRGTLGRFLSFAVHEINTPMTAVYMTIANFEDGLFGSLNADQKKWMNLLRDQSLRLAGLLWEMRDFTHMIMLGDFKPARERVEMSKVLEEAVGQAGPGAERSGIPLSAAQTDPGLAAWGDGERLAKMCASLIFYARRLRVEGGIRIAAAGRGEDEVDLRVEFQGPEMKPSDARRSLDLYYPADVRAGKAARGAPCTGLGLGVLRELALRQGGDLDFEALPGGRLALCLRLPRCRGNAKI